MPSNKLIVQDQYGQLYRLRRWNEPPVKGPAQALDLSNKDAAWEFVIGLRMEHDDWLSVLHEMDATSVNSDISLYESQDDIALLMMRGGLTAYRLGNVALDGTGNYPSIKASGGVQYHFVPQGILLLCDPDDDVKSFRGNNQQAQQFINNMALTDEQLTKVVTDLKLQHFHFRTPHKGQRAEYTGRLAWALGIGEVAIVIAREQMIPPRKTGPADLPVEPYTHRPMTLGPHDEPGYVPPPVVKSKTEQRKEHYQQRKQTAANAGNSPAQQAAAARLLDNNDNILRAESAAYVYRVDEFKRGHIDTLPAAPTGLNLLDPNEIPGLENATFTSKKTGFGAALFESDINGETMLTYRGTNNGVTGKKDWLANVSQGAGRETAQYEQAMELAIDVKRQLGQNFVTVGHSLGGGLASSGTAVAGVKGYTYNAAGLHPDTAARKGGMSNEAAARHIQTRAVDGDVLTGAQRYGNKALSGLGAGGGAMVGGLLGAGLGFLASRALPDIPEALGEMKPLPSVNGGSPVARHGMDQVIDGIEAQKRKDIDILAPG